MGNIRSMLQKFCSTINKKTQRYFKGVYQFRKARIVVNPPPFVATAISAIANEEAKA